MNELQELFEFLQKRNELSVWVCGTTFSEFVAFLNEEAAEAARAKDEYANNKELGDMLIIVLTMVCKYGQPDAVFEAALTKMKKRAPFVLKNESVSYDEEVAQWQAGK